MMKRIILFVTIGLCVGMNSCKKETVDNPYDKYNNPPIDTSDNTNLNATSIEGLYQQIFKPTCANSGCHDGTFEPDFRTIQSTYNSLVYQPIIKNDATAPLTYRVVPGNIASSMIIRRLEIDLNGNSGIMPLVVDPLSDWPAKKDAYISNIKTWIENGAKDLAGNAANPVNKVPQLNGMQITASGSSTPLSRDVNGTVLIPANTSNIDIYFSLSDAETAAANLTINSAKLSKARDDFSQAINVSATSINPVSFAGYSGGAVNYTHKISISGIQAMVSPSNQLFFAVSVSDGTNTVSLPGYYAMDQFKVYYSLKIQ
jgi:hypothetical protein